MKYIIFIVTLILITQSLSPIDDNIPIWPEYPTQNFKTYNGFISIDEGIKKLHYIFFESQNDPSTDPVIVWLGGGPGCTCLLGLIREIGPYVIQNDKTEFEQNPYALNKIANILFLDIPPGVGFSTVDDPTYQFTDINTGQDTYAALLEWFKAYTDFQNHDYWIGGESYSGMYVPYTAQALLEGNKESDTKIKLKGIMVGNGILVNEEPFIEKGNTVFKGRRNFYDPVTQLTLYHQCSINVNSVSCKQALQKQKQAEKQINPYNVYDRCWADTSKFEFKHGSYEKVYEEENNAPCIDAGPLHSYFNKKSVQDALKIIPNRLWLACNNDIFDTYQRDQAGSHKLMKTLSDAGLRILQYSGNTDSVVSSKYTLNSLNEVPGIEIVKKWTSFSNNETKQLAGWIVEYNYLTLYIIRGAGHNVPYDQRANAFQMFQEFLTRK